MYPLIHSYTSRQLEFSPTVSPTQSTQNQDLNAKIEQLGQKHLFEHLLGKRQVPDFILTQPPAKRFATQATVNAFKMQFIHALDLLQRDLSAIKIIDISIKQEIEFISFYTNVLKLSYETTGRTFNTLVYIDELKNNHMYFYYISRLRNIKVSYLDEEFVCKWMMHYINFTKEQHKINPNLDSDQECVAHILASGHHVKCALLQQVPYHQDEYYLENAIKFLDAYPNLLKYMYIYPFTLHLKEDFVQKIGADKIEAIQKQEQDYNRKFIILMNHVAQKFPQKKKMVVEN